MSWRYETQHSRSWEGGGGGGEGWGGRAGAGVTTVWVSLVRASGRPPPHSRIDSISLVNQVLPDPVLI